MAKKLSELMLYLTTYTKEADNWPRMEPELNSNYWSLLNPSQ